MTTNAPKPLIVERFEKLPNTSGNIALIETGRTGRGIMVVESNQNFSKIITDTEIRPRNQQIQICFKLPTAVQNHFNSGNFACDLQFLVLKIDPVAVKVWPENFTSSRELLFQKIWNKTWRTREVTMLLINWKKWFCCFEVSHEINYDDCMKCSRNWHDVTYFSAV